MKKFLPFGLILAVVLIGGIWLSQRRSSENNMMPEENAMVDKITEDEDSIMEEQDKMMEENDQMVEEGDFIVGEEESAMMPGEKAPYVEYSKANLDQAANGRRVLFFYANWCPVCRPADADFRSNVERFPPNLTLIRVNYNDTDTDSEEKELAKKYGITYQHTFVQIDSQGNAIAKWNGGKTSELIKNIK